MDIPSTSAPMAKRPKIDEEKKSEGKKLEASNDLNHTITNTTVEDVIFKVILFCSKEDNYHPNEIKSELIPSLIKDSKNLTQGKVDITKHQYLSNSQLSYLLAIFKDCIKIKVDHLTTNNILFEYLKKFKNLKKLTIFVNENDKFTSLNPLTLLTITSVKIVAKHGPNWDDSIDEILDRCPMTSKISIEGGNLSLITCIKTQAKQIYSLSLHNVKILPQNKNAFISTLRDCKNLKNLKLVTTKSYLSNVTFHRTLREFLSVFIMPNTTIETLTFTLNQYDQQDLSNLLNFTNLKELTIFYSAQYESKNLTDLLRILKYTSDIKITFKEYYFTSDLGASISNLYVYVLKDRSYKYENYIKSCCPHAKVISVDNYDKLIKHN